MAETPTSAEPKKGEPLAQQIGYGALWCFAVIGFITVVREQSPRVKELLTDWMSPPIEESLRDFARTANAGTPARDGTSRLVQVRAEGRKVVFVFHLDPGVDLNTMDARLHNTFVQQTVCTNDRDRRFVRRGAVYEFDYYPADRRQQPRVMTVATCPDV